MNLQLALADPFILRVGSRLAARRQVAQPVDVGLVRAAVSILLRVPAAESPELLLIRRAEFEGDPWSGHIALPGGRQEVADADLEHTAVRETREEIALDLNQHGRVLGSLHDVWPSNPRLPRVMIRPFVAVVDDAVNLELSAEVAAAFWVPLSRISDPASRASSMVTSHDRSFDVSGYQLGDHFVWGLTERILRDFLELMNRG